ncbi:MAG: S41 family peptidase [Acidobacteriota bacterium]
MNVTAALFLGVVTAATDADRWMADFEQIVCEIDSHYANLDSVIVDRGMDLPEIEKSTAERLRSVNTDDEARAVINGFLNAFGDGHVGVEWSIPASPADLETAGTLCDRLGYRAREDRSGIDFSRIPEYRPIDDEDSADVPGGILPFHGGAKAGVVRIQLFSSDQHPRLCRIAQRQLKLADDQSCEGDCRHRFNNRVDDLLTASLERRLKSLRRAGATTIVVDITGNGGGSDWVEPAARVLTPIPLQASAMGFIRHAHWVKQLGEELDDVEYDLVNGGAKNVLLQRAAKSLREAKNAASSTCQGPCPMIVSRSLFASGVLSYAKPGSLPEGRASSTLFHPSRYTYHEGANELPLIILVDQRTASASEYFSALMQDNGAGTVAGQPTRGAGCGHTNGGIYATLANSGARLSLPDCARFRSDGSNEVVGITPDVLIPWGGVRQPLSESGEDSEGAPRNGCACSFRILNSSFDLPPSSRSRRGTPNLSSRSRRVGISGETRSGFVEPAEDPSSLRSFGVTCSPALRSLHLRCARQDNGCQIPVFGSTLLCSAIWQDGTLTSLHSLREARDTGTNR